MRSFYGSESTNVTGQWHPEPTFRGTYSILSTCLITMGISVWTAVHLNIPAYGERKWFSPQLFRKIMWVLIGLLAPEVVSGTLLSVFWIWTYSIRQLGLLLSSEGRRSDSLSICANVFDSRVSRPVRSANSGLRVWFACCGKRNNW